MPKWEIMDVKSGEELSNCSEVVLLKKHTWTVGEKETVYTVACRLVNR